MQHKCANHENPNQDAEVRTFHSARSTRTYRREKYGGNQDRYESRDQSNRHNSFHFFLRSEYARVLAGFSDKTWHQPKQ